jgi:TonB-dependent SusC/RagA subfamily outer membrane receptor
MNFYPTSTKPSGKKNNVKTVNASYQKIISIMKLTVVLITMFCVQLHAAVFSQQVTLNQQNVSLEKVLKEIKRQTGYFFLYDMDLIKEKSKPVSINVTNMAIEKVMAQALKSQPFTWEIKVNTILIKPIPSQLDKVTNAQEKAIDLHGKVIDENGQGLPGATVKVAATGKVTTTDINGNFTLRNVSDDAILTISYIGYVTKDINAAAANGTISLLPQVGALDNVVITGYTNYSRNQSTNAATLVTADKINQVPGLTVDQILQGRVAGMSVISTSGQPGQSAAVTIRGVGSVNGSSTPLYILDGIPIEGGYFQTINPEDIESATVLKDASAKALYGSRGSNGVIVLTTKKGKSAVQLAIRLL